MDPMDINKMGGQEAVLQDYYNRMLKKNYGHYDQAKKIINNHPQVIMEHADKEDEANLGPVDNA